MSVSTTSFVPEKTPSRQSWAGVRVWQITFGGGRPPGRRPPLQRANVAYARRPPRTSRLSISEGWSVSRIALPTAAGSAPAFGLQANNRPSRVPPYSHALAIPEGAGRRRVAVRHGCRRFHSRLRACACRQKLHTYLPPNRSCHHRPAYGQLSAAPVRSSQDDT